MNCDTQQITRLRQRIASVMKTIRATTPYDPTVDPNVAKAPEVWPGHLDDQPISRLIIYLRSSGCSWSVGPIKDGTPILRPGCLDCVHSLAGTTFGRPISADSYVRQFVGTYRPYADRGFRMLCLYNEGNFFNPAELPDLARREILRLISQDPRIEAVVLESLPEYLTEDILAETRAYLADRRLEIGVGLESSDQLVRTLCVNKSYALDDFARVAPLIKRYAQLLVYVLVKPCFLSERESIVDAINTSQYAAAVGADIISLEPVNLSPYNMSGVLAAHGLHRAGWLWSVIEIVRSIIGLGPEVRIGGDQFAPTYTNKPRNCDACTRFAHALFSQFNETADPHVFDVLQCACRAQWHSDLERPLPSLLDRIESALDVLDNTICREIRENASERHQS